VLQSHRLEARECHSYLEVKDLPCVNRDTGVVVWLLSQVQERLNDIFGRYGRELGSEHSLSLGLRNICLANVKHFKANVVTFSVTVQPQDHEIHSSRSSCQVGGHCLRRLIYLAESRSFEKVLRLCFPVLKLLREVPVENMAAH